MTDLKSSVFRNDDPEGYHVGNEHVCANCGKAFMWHNGEELACPT